MAKGKSEGEAPFYEVGGGRISGARMLANDAGAGTPPAPGRRGEAYGGHVEHGLGKPPSKAGGIYKRQRASK